MVACINKNSVLFQTLKNRSGLSEFVLESICRNFIDKHNRWPNLDELPNVDSSNSLKLALNLSDEGFTNTQTILDYFGTDNIKDAVIQANKQFSDLEVSILLIRDEAIVSYIHRPTEYNLNEEEPVTINKNVNFPIYLNFQLLKLVDKYGIEIIPITTSELNLDERFADFPIDAQSNRGFIYNGKIYLNTDNLRVDTPIHEILHLLFGSLRFLNPELYVKLISTAESFPSYNYNSKYFLNRTRLDLNEELFIQEFAKYVTNQVSEIQNLDENDLYEINYNMNRILDSMLMGKYSSKIINNKYLMSFRQIAELVKSSTLNGVSESSLTDSVIHRTLDNMKSDLISKNELKEYC